jgi:hypothetical protein
MGPNYADAEPLSIGSIVDLWATANTRLQDRVDALTESHRLIDAHIRRSVEDLIAEVARLTAENEALRAEIVRLEGLVTW